MPEHQFTPASPDFACTCTVLIQEQDFRAKGTATQKKKAKQVAAKEMLMQLQRWFHDGERLEVKEPEASVAPSAEEQASQSAPASISTSHPILVKELKNGQNFIGFLQQLC